MISYCFLIGNRYLKYTELFCELKGIINKVVLPKQKKNGHWKAFELVFKFHHLEKFQISLNVVFSFFTFYQSTL